MTCPPEGYDTNGAPSAHETGFFHVARTEEAEGDAKEFFYEAVNKISDTQCEEVDVGGGEAELHPTADGSRPESSSWPKMEGETDLNPEGGFCSMPTQFLGTVRIGGLHRIPRWMSITENSFRDPPERTEWQSECTDSIPLYVRASEVACERSEGEEEPEKTTKATATRQGHQGEAAPKDRLR